MNNWTGWLSFLSALVLSAAGLRTPNAEAADLNSMTSPVLFRGDARTTHRDPAAIYPEGVFHLYSTLVRIEDDGTPFLHTAWSKSRDPL